MSFTDPNEVVDIQAVLKRIVDALETAKTILQAYTPGAVAVAYKQGDDPVTEADTAVDKALRDILPSGNEGWLSEETLDDPVRLTKRRLWIVDPLDGTREFVSGIPEWGVSIGYVVDGIAVAGGVYNPATDEFFLGSSRTGVQYNGQPCSVHTRNALSGAVVLASRSETKRGEWDRFASSPFTIRPMGSIAYKLACVAAGLADATWTLVPKNEWDIAAGVALVEAAGGSVCTKTGRAIRFNQQPKTLINGLIATAPGLMMPVKSLLGV